MRDDPEYWEALSTRIVARIRDRRPSPLGWRVWAAPLVAAAVLAILIASGKAPSTVVQPPTIAARLAPEQNRAPSIVVLLQEEP